MVQDFVKQRNCIGYIYLFGGPEAEFECWLRDHCLSGITLRYLSKPAVITDGVPHLIVAEVVKNRGTVKVWSVYRISGKVKDVLAGEHGGLTLVWDESWREDLENNSAETVPIPVDIRDRRDWQCVLSGV